MSIERYVESRATGSLPLSSVLIKRFNRLALDALDDALGIGGDWLRLAAALLLIVFGVMRVPALSNRFTQLMTPLAGFSNQANQPCRGESDLVSFMYRSVHNRAQFVAASITIRRQH